MTVITCDQFGEVFGLTIRAAQMAFAGAVTGKPWRGEALHVVALPGQRGGKGGMVWGLVLDKCSPALRAKFEAVHPALKAPVNAPCNGAIQPWQFEEQSARLEAIRPILATDKRSTARDVAYRQAAAQPRVINGKLGYHVAVAKSAAIRRRQFGGRVGEAVQSAT